MLTGSQRAYLRSIAQKQNVILHIGKAGITEQVLQEARDALAARELVKGKVLDAAMLTAAEASAAICEACGADGVMLIGRVFAVYKPRPDKPKIALPAP